MDMITLGETLAVLTACTPGPLRYSSQFTLHTGGAETNVAVGMTRLGHPSGWISRLGADEFGRLIYAVMRGEGVDVSRVRFDAEAPTGVFFKERREVGESRNLYYRHGSAASRLTPADLDPAYFRGARLLHLTGITPVLSASCQATVARAIEIAREEGLLVSFDPNLRLRIRPLPDAGPIVLGLMRQADILLPGFEEARLLLETHEPGETLDALLGLGASRVALKLGAQGSLVADTSRRYHVPAFPVARVVDPFGAGDAFAAGFLSGVLEGRSLEEAATMGNAAGALALGVTGNIEGLPFREELEAFIRGKAQLGR